MLGYPTSVDDLLWVTETDIGSAVNDGMTLAETHDTAMEYIAKLELPVFIEAYHFDRFRVSAANLWEAACLESSDAQDVTILNFHSGIAHGWATGGGGHFALLLGPSRNDRSLVVADVHAQKYGRFWSQSVEAMYEAMIDRDSIGRSRGLLRIGLLSSSGKQLARPLPSLASARTTIAWDKPPAAYNSLHLQKYCQDQDQGFVCRHNMGGVSAVAIALRALGHAWVTPDSLMRTLRMSYTGALAKFFTVDDVNDVLAQLQHRNLLHVNFHRVPIVNGELGAALAEAGAGVGFGRSANIAVMLRYNVNTALGGEAVPAPTGEAAKLHHGEQRWGVLAAWNSEAEIDDREGLIMAAVDTAQMGRLWCCSQKAMAAGLAELGSTELIVISGTDDSISLPTTQIDV